MPSVRLTTHTSTTARTSRSSTRLVTVLLAVATTVAALLAAVAWSPAAVAATTTYVNGHPVPADDKSACGTIKTAGTLCVRAAEDSVLLGSGGGAGGQGPGKNDPVTKYKWLLNRDNTGSVTLGSDGKTPVASEVSACHPTTSTAPSGNPNYPNGTNGSGPIQIDGSPNPLACNWPSIHNITSSPVVSTGNEADWNTGTALPKFDSTSGRGLADGKYLVSVTSNGFQIGGAHFSVKGGVFSGVDVNTAGVVVVGLNPLPIPLANIRLKVYGDMGSTNAQWDEQSEFGLPGFDGKLTDYDGPVTVDYYANPLCTAYQLDPAYNSSHPDPTDSYYHVKLALDGRPIIDPTMHIRGAYEVAGPSTGRCTSDGNGDILIPYLAPNRYAASVTADQNPAMDPVSKKVVPAQTTCAVLGTTANNATTAIQNQACWAQTTTLEGNHDFDAWPQANSTGYDTELLVGGELVPQVQFGFVRAGCMANVTTGRVDYTGLTDPASWLPPSSPACANLPRSSTGAIPGGAIKGRILGADAYYPGIGGLAGTGGNSGTAGYKFDRPVQHPWVTISDLNNGDKTIWASNANLDGSFGVNGVPDGSYSVAVWDQMQDYIFDSFNVTVAGGKVVDLGVVPLLEWWTRITGHICIDTNSNGRCDPGEAGVPKFLVQNLDRTNNAQEGGQNTDVTDDQGYYEFTEAYPLGYNDVIQAFNTRYKTTGVTWQSCNDPQEHTTLTGIVDVQYNPIIAQCGRLDWAVQPYAAAQTPPADANKPITRADNGGIVATVYYASVRNRLLGRTQPAQSFYTGIPGVLTELFQPTAKAPDNAPATQMCNGVSAPNVSYNHYFLNCDGSYKTTGGLTNGGYSTSYGGGQVTATDRYAAPGTVNAYQSEHYARGTGCVARDANGNIISGSRSADGSVVGTQPDGTTVTDFLPGLSTDPTSANPGHYTQACIEAPASGVNFSLGTDALPLDPNVPGGDTHGVQTVDGNFALTPTDGNGNPATGDFLVKADIPGDKVLPAVDGGADRPLYKVADETSMNNFANANLDPWTADLGTGAANAPGHATTPEFVPQNADLTKVYNADGSSVHTNLGTCNGSPCAAFSFPPQAAKPSQTPVATPTPGGESPTTLNEDPNTASPSPDPQCAGPQFVVNVTDPGFQSVGGSPLQGATRNSCDVHLIHLGGGQSVAPNFYLYTDVPTPSTFIIQNFDDTNLSTNKGETQYGDAAPIPNSPEGIYDWHGNLAYQTNTDPNGIAEALMPSTDVADCATPAGICQNIYRFVGNDPGTITHPNVNYNPQYQTITANFQALPGVFTPADTAPIRSALAFINGGQKFSAAANCTAPGTTAPQLFSIDRPYTDFSTHGPNVVLKGVGFGAATGSVTLSRTGSAVALSVTSWSDTEIHATVPAGTAPAAYQLSVTTAGSPGVTTVNGVGYHVIGSATSAYHPTVLEVGPSFTGEATTLAGWTAQTQFPSIQEALERAAGYWLQPTGSTLTYTPEPGSALPGAVVVVYPATAATQSPTNSASYSGVWYEPIIVHSAVTVQGVGPGGVQPGVGTAAATAVPGTVIDGRYYFSLTDTSTTPAAIDWSTAPQDVRAQHAVDVWQVVAGASFPKTPGTDNKLITEGQNVTVLAQNDQAEYSSSLHPALDGFGLQAAITINTPANVNAQTGQKTGPAGGADATQGGALFLNGHDDYTRITNNVIDGNSGSYGAVRVGSPQLSGQHNWNVEFGNNQIVANGGNNLGGGMALFADSGGYRIHDNVICGNQSAEYGGGMSQYGLSIAPVTFTGVLNKPGTVINQIKSASGGNIAFPFSRSDVGHSITGPGLKNATITAVNPGGNSIAINGQNSQAAFNVTAGRGSFDAIPSTGTAQTNSNAITHNRITLNQSQDEGGGIMIAGELPADATKASTGTGPVTISANTIAVNAANDDGGGIRFLQAGNFPMRVENNIVSNNVSAHEGGGISIDDTAQVTIINNTIAKNITTATAATSDGTAAPAGISTAHNSAPFQAQLAAISLTIPKWSDPQIINDVIYDNRAGSWNATNSNVSGIGATGDTAPFNEWDIGIADPGAGLLSPVNSLLSTPSTGLGSHPYNFAATDKLTAYPAAGAVNNDPKFQAPFDLQLLISPMRINFRFRSTAIVNIGLPANGVGDYHTVTGSPAALMGTRSVPTPPRPYTGPILAPTVDIDGRSRPPAPTAPDAGANQTVAPLPAPAARMGLTQLGATTNGATR